MEQNDYKESKCAITTEHQVVHIPQQAHARQQSEVTAIIKSNWRSYEHISLIYRIMLVFKKAKHETTAYNYNECANSLLTAT